MRARSSLGSHPCAVAVFALVIGGCGAPLDHTTRPTLATDAGANLGTIAATGLRSGPGGTLSQGGFYPLTLGNRWGYRKEFVIQIVPDIGDAPLPVSYRSTIGRELVCAEVRGGRTYLVERVTEQASDGLSYRSWIRYRQDPKGLYEAHVSISEPPPCERAAGPPAGLERTAFITGAAPWPDDLVPMGSPAVQAAFRTAWERLRERMALLDGRERSSPRATPGLSMGGTGLPDELIRLRYPLRPGARWLIRSGPFGLAAEVTGVDDLLLPPGKMRGYRIRLSTDAFGPEDGVHVWYGRWGYLQLIAHFEFDAVDQTGNVIGRAITEQRETLVDLRLAKTEFAAVPLWESRLRE